MVSGFTTDWPPGIGEQYRKLGITYEVIEIRGELEAILRPISSENRRSIGLMILAEEWDDWLSSARQITP